MTWDPAQALRDADLAAILPTLEVRANRLLAFAGWRPGRGTQPSRLEVQELISEAVKRVLAGNRKWHRPDDGEITGYMCKVMESIAQDARRAACRQILEADPSIVGDMLLLRERVDPDANDEPVLALATKAAGDDAEMKDFISAVECGPYKREEIADLLGWPVDKVSVVRKKLRRRMDKIAESADPRRWREPS